MKDNAPGLFDFDDEELFPKIEKEEPVVVPDQQPDGTSTESYAETNNANSKEKPATSGSKIKIAFEAPQAVETTFANAEVNIESQCGMDSSVQNDVVDFIKPNLELPISETEETVFISDEKDSESPIPAPVISFDEPLQTDWVAEPEDAREEANFQEEIPPVKPEEPIIGLEAKKENPVPEDLSETSETTVVPALPEWQLDKRYYTIGDVAKLFYVNVSLIRFWATEFKIKTRTTRKGDRLFSPAQIGELRLIYHLVRVNKYTLKGAKEVLKNGGGQLEKNLNLRDELQQLYNTLSAIRAAL